VTAISNRSYEPIGDDQLARLSAIAAADLADRIARRPQWTPYAKRIICVCLCQGAALHFVDGVGGVKDLDVWTFLAAATVGAFPPRWRTVADFGPSPHGRHPADGEGFAGRRVDLYCRSLDEPPHVEPLAALERYLSRPRTGSARRLVGKAVVLVDPPGLRGTIAYSRVG
jgi:hypothetical protein